MPCAKCKRGPGKFEGESALTVMAYWHATNGNADVSGDAGQCGLSVDFFKSPLQFDADSEALDAARAEGFCGACIAQAIDDARELAGCSITEDSQGFVYLETYDSADAYNAAVVETMSEVDEEELEDA